MLWYNINNIQCVLFVCYYHILFRCPIINSKHKILSIIFLRRGKKMSCYFYILCKYWRKHLRTALSLLFSGLLLTAIITSVFLFIREEINREVETGYDSFGKYDLILSGIPDDIKNELIPSDLTFTPDRDRIWKSRFLRQRI